MFGFICFGAGSAVAKDYQTLCITRFFQGAMGACPIAITTAAYADMYNVYHRGYATTAFVSTPAPFEQYPLTLQTTGFHCIQRTHVSIATGRIHR